MISKRSLGETWFAGETNNIDGGQPYTAVNDSPFFSSKVIPQTNKTFAMITTTRGGGLGATGGASNANSGYIEGTTYGTSCRNAANTGAGIGVGMRIRVDTTITIGSVPNIIETFTIMDFGTTPYSLKNETIIMDIPANDGTSQIFTITSPMNVNYFSSNIERYDGSKHYPLNIGFTGLTMYEDTQIDNGSPAFDVSNEYDVDKLDNSPTKRTNNIELEIPKGFSTPSAVGGILTDQLSRPEKISAIYNKGDFLD